MIPELPSSVSMADKLKFYSDVLSNLEDQSTIHINWHTHKQNPAVCWICDIPICARKIAYIVEQFITKSPLDSETELSSEYDSDTEIEDEFLNKNEELSNQPEYDVVDDDRDSHTEEEL